MGHNRQPKLPASRSWQDVVELLDSSAPPATVIARAASAAQRSFGTATDDPVYVEAVRLLVSVADAARSKDVTAKLRREGLELRPNARLFDFLEAVAERLDRAARDSHGASDIGQLAQRSLLATLHSKLLDRMPGLFSEQPDDLPNALRQFSSPNGFSDLARSFFTRMTSETLAYWLERSLGAHIGNVQERNDFDAALAQFSAEATRIIQEFCTGWYAKNVLRADRAPDGATRAFAAVAFKKINDEMRRKTGVHD